MTSPSQIEALEPRTLFSASPLIQADLRVIHAQGKVIRADVNLLRKKATTDLNLIHRDVQRAGTLNATRSLLNTLGQTQRPALTQLNKQTSTLLKVATKDVNRVVSDFHKVQNKPTNTVFQARFTADVAVLQSEISPAEQAVAAGAVLLFNDTNADLSAIAVANPTNTLIQADVTQTKTHLSDTGQTIATEAGTLVTDVQTLLSALTT